jgi:hypothetical protein
MIQACGPPWETIGPKIIMQSSYHHVYGPEAPFVCSALLPKKPEPNFTSNICNTLQNVSHFSIRHVRWDCVTSRHS